MPEYVIADKEGRYIYRNKRNDYTPVKRLDAATRFPNKKKAENILLNCLPKALRNRYHIEEYPDEEEDEPTLSPKQIRQIRHEHIQKHMDSAMEEYKDANDRIRSWQESITKLTEFAQSIETNRDALSDSLSKVDREIIDIHHYIEFYGSKFNAYQGWEAFSLLRSCLLRRRKIKDELTVAESICECPIKLEPLQDISTTIQSMNNRKYHPRELTGLFKDKQGVE